MLVDSEMASRRLYEELLVSNPSSTRVIRMYAKLLADVYDDEVFSAELFILFYFVLGVHVLNVCRMTPRCSS
jgi:hypothetical protein